MSRPSLRNPASSLHVFTTMCPRCRCAVLAALDAPVAALDVRLDPDPLDPATELAALLRGQFTYDLIKFDRHHEITYRDQWRITKRDHPVLATHHCPGRIPASAIPRITTKKGAAHGQRPPF